MFEGLPTGTADESGSYEPGRSGIERTVAQEMVGFYIEGSEGCFSSSGHPTNYSLIPGSEDFKRCAAAVVGLIAGRDCDPQALIDATLFSALEHLTTPYQWRHIYSLLDPLVQALYDLGGNGFVVDARDFPEQTYELGHLLAGTPERPLECCYLLGDLSNDYFLVSHPAVASGVRDCRFEFLGNFSGKPVIAGHRATSSEITFRGNVLALGLYAEDSVFHLFSSGGMDQNSMNCAYYIHLADDALVARRMADRLSLGVNMAWNQLFGFSRRKNRLFVPDGKGAWKRVMV